MLIALTTAVLLPLLGAEKIPLLSGEGGYIGSTSCSECHKDEHASWHRSFHRSMTQMASPETVLGHFNGSTVTVGGLGYRVFKEGTNFMAEMPDPDLMMLSIQGKKPRPLDQIPRVTLPVVMATGSHHYQTYWVPSPRFERLLQTLPIVHLISDNKWIPRPEAFVRGPNAPDRMITQWNHHCIRCHSTAGNPGLNEKTGLLETRVAEFGISCESCHGPAHQHLETMRERKNTGATEDIPRELLKIVNPARLEPKRSSQVCGQCHGVFIMRDEYAMASASSGSLYRPGDDLEKTRHYIQHPAHENTPERRADYRANRQFYAERFWEDGTMLAGGREYTAMSASGCFKAGKISCVSCHSMHKSDPNDQLKRSLSDSQMCAQCHSDEKFTSAVEKHTFHKSGSDGSNCLNCHMPHTSYALFKGIRGHGISSPSIRSSSRYGTPNACNLCHLDKTLAWAQDHLVRNYGAKPEPLSADQQNISAAVLWLLKGHAAQRVVTAWHTGWAPAQRASGTNWLAPFQAQLLDDSYGPVRYVASTALKTLPEFQSLQYDFLAPSSNRLAIADFVLKQWSAGQFSSNAAILLGSSGLDKPVLERLVRERDQRPITIKE